MKTKPIFTALVMAALSLSSCSSNDPAELVAPVQEEVTQTVTFTASLPSTVASRSRSDSHTGTIVPTSFGTGTSATYLYYAVFLEGASGKVADDTFITTNYKEDGTVAQFSELKTSVTFNLVLGKTYRIVFWAQHAQYGAENAPYTFDPSNGTITLNTSYLICNDDNLDAFFTCEEFTPTATVTAPGTVTLHRPFAQLNIGTTDATTAAAAGVTVAKTTVTVADALTKLDLRTGLASEKADVTYAYTAVPADTYTFPVTDKSVDKYLTMAYVLVNTENTTSYPFFGVEGSTDSSATLNVTFNYKDKVGNVLADANAKVMYNVPFNRNHRTNIYGGILTTSSEWNVEIDPNFLSKDFTKTYDEVKTAPGV